METLTILPKFHVVIPKSIPEMLKLAPGQKVQAVVHLDRSELILVKQDKLMDDAIKRADLLLYPVRGNVRNRIVSN